MNKKRIFYYVYDKKLVDISRNIPNIENRAVVVQSLIATYNLIQKCQICPCEEATDEDLLSFHSSRYLECLKKIQTSSDLEKVSDCEEFTDFNLGYDCPVFEDIYDFAKLIAGSTLTAARQLCKNFELKRTFNSSSTLNSQPKSYLKFKNGLKMLKNKDVYDAPHDFSYEEFEEIKDEKVVRSQNGSYETEAKPVKSDILPVSINWFGGWHHAERDEAGGFCYVNDIVIGIQYLLKFYKRVIYVDLDIHHGNGVENAFLFSPKVLTLSMHKYEAGFYPATGSLHDVGEGKGKFYSVNVPLRSGITDDKYVRVFDEIFRKIMQKFLPDCAVVQCGADCLAGDPLGGFGLTLNGIGRCLKLVLDEKLPTMILGGGGYNVPNAARCWAYLTSLTLECPISNDIPDNSVSGWIQFLHLYGPEYELGIAASLRKDENSDEYLQTVVATVLHNLENIE